MLAFHSSDQIKSNFLRRVNAHAAADEIIHGTYWRDGKGCAFGCTFHSNNHWVSEIEAGIPLAMSCLEDVLFEAMAGPESFEWPLRYLRAIQVGADLSLVAPRFLLWLIRDSGLPKPRTSGYLRVRASAAVRIMEEWCDVGFTGEKQAKIAYTNSSRITREIGDHLAAVISKEGEEAHDHLATTINPFRSALFAARMVARSNGREPYYWNSGHNFRETVIWSLSSACGEPDNAERYANRFLQLISEAPVPTRPY